MERAAPLLEVPLYIHKLSLKDKIDRSQKAQAGPEEIEAQRLAHVKDGEGDEDGEGDHLLEDLQLPQVHYRIAQAVGRDLDQVFQEGDAPTGQGGQVPGFAAQVFQMGIPGEGHEEIGQGQQDGAFDDDGHGQCMFLVSVIFFGPYIRKAMKDVKG